MSHCQRRKEISELKPKKKKQRQMKKTLVWIISVHNRWSIIAWNFEISNITSQTMWFSWCSSHVVNSISIVLPSRFTYFCFRSIYINDMFILKINKFSFEYDCGSYNHRHNNICKISEIVFTSLYMVQYFCNFIEEYVQTRLPFSVLNFVKKFG